MFDFPLLLMSVAICFSHTMTLDPYVKIEHLKYDFLTCGCQCVKAFIPGPNLQPVYFGPFPSKRENVARAVSICNFGKGSAQLLPTQGFGFSSRGVYHHPHGSRQLPRRGSPPPPRAPEPDMVLLHHLWPHLIFWCMSFIITPMQIKMRLTMFITKTCAYIQSTYCIHMRVYENHIMPIYTATYSNISRFLAQHSKNIIVICLIPIFAKSLHCAPATPS